MKFQQVKKDSELKLEGFEIETERVDGSLKSVVFKKEGKILFRVQMESYNMYVQRPADPKMKDAFSLKGTVIGIPVEQIYFQEYEAQRAKQKMEDSVTNESDAQLTIEKVQVESDED